jgi:hypothetical protein
MLRFRPVRVALLRAAPFAACGLFFLLAHFGWPPISSHLPDWMTYQIINRRGLAISAALILAFVSAAIAIRVLYPVFGR